MTDLDAIRAATRELHELVQEAKDVRAGLAYDIAAIKGQVQAVIAEEVRRELGELGEATKQAIDKATAGVYARFDTITDILLGVDAESRRKGKPPLAKFAELVNERARAAETPVPTPEPEEVVDALRADAPAE